MPYLGGVGPYPHGADAVGPPRSGPNAAIVEWKSEFVQSVKHDDLIPYAIEIAMRRKPFRPTELKMPDIVGLSPILTQKLTHFRI